VIVEKNASATISIRRHGVTLGEQLIADVYNTLRASSAWTKTLLLVLWDEPGGSMTACRRGWRRRQTTDDRQSQGRTVSSSTVRCARAGAPHLAPHCRRGSCPPAVCHSITRR
jgi:hypothetical protein